MNYFEFYKIPVSFFPDEEELKKIFYLNSKLYHPDFHVNEDHGKQEEILEMSTLNNNAYEVLRDLERRVEYILVLKGHISENEKYTLPQDFLMEMMEINEALMEMEMEPAPETLEKIRSQVHVTDTKLSEEMISALKEFDGLKEGDGTPILLKVKDIYYRKKYLLRIKDSLNKFAAS